MLTINLIDFFQLQIHQTIVISILALYANMLFLQSNFFFFSLKIVAFNYRCCETRATNTGTDNANDYPTS
ncbi:hypothetical protein BGS_1157 [Beggiatoa sp. SS]|nr:hypothetical protein BGS_1157 [Beggiatoa sp. SS]